MLDLLVRLNLLFGILTIMLAVKLIYEDSIALGATGLVISFLCIYYYFRLES